MMGGNLVTLEKVKVLHYRAGAATATAGDGGKRRSTFVPGNTAVAEDGHTPYVEKTP
jgi:hypothetical protein